MTTAKTLAGLFTSRGRCQLTILVVETAGETYTLTELATEAGVTKGTVFRALPGYLQCGLLEQLPDEKVYRADPDAPLVEAVHQLIETIETGTDSES
jgi:DNA-binding IclR family transcriptional regulator